MVPEERIPVLIIGGGIVGLTASLCLADHGIKSFVIERHSGTSIHPRARSVNARTMEIFNSLGIENRIHEAAAPIAASMGIYTGTSVREVIEPKSRSETPRKNPLSGMMDSISPVNGTFITQDMLEPLLGNVARERGVDVRFSTESLGIQQDGEGVTATLKNRENGVISIVRAEYLIAADGAGSPIRKQLEVPITGRRTMGHLLNILFEADLESFVKGREFSLCIVERPEVNGICTSINNRERWVFHLLYDPSKGEKPEDFAPERCENLLRLALGFPELKIEIKSIMPWKPSVRVVERLQHGRIFFAGDAAHQMPPWAGQGANSGIADVHNLSWKLSAVLKGLANNSLLETYDPERLPVGKAAAEASANAADERGVISTKKNLSNIMSLLGRIHLMSGHGYCYDSTAICPEDTSPLGGMTWRPWTLPSLFLYMDGRPGSRVPHLWIKHQGNRVSTLNMTGKKFVLLAGNEGKSWLVATTKVSNALNMDIATYCVGPQGDLVAPKGSFESAVGITSDGAILVRPDDFVVWRQRRKVSDQDIEIEKAMKKAMCIS